jgi:hypothetical protein
VVLNLARPSSSLIPTFLGFIIFQPHNDIATNGVIVQYFHILPVLSSSKTIDGSLFSKDIDLRATGNMSSEIAAFEAEIKEYKLQVSTYVPPSLENHILTHTF